MLEPVSHGADSHRAGGLASCGSADSHRAVDVSPDAMVAVLSYNVGIQQDAAHDEAMGTQRHLRPASGRGTRGLPRVAPHL